MSNRDNLDADMAHWLARSPLSVSDLAMELLITNRFTMVCIIKDNCVYLLRNTGMEHYSRNRVRVQGEGEGEGSGPGVWSTILGTG